MAITDRRIGTQIYGGKAPTKYTVYKPPKPQPKPKPVATIKDFKVADAAMSAPKQIQAEVGDTWDVIAEKIGVPTKSLLEVNPKDTTIKAGAVYNVPTKPDNMTTDEWTASLNPPIPTPIPDNKSFFNWASNLEGGDVGGGLQNWVSSAADWIGNLITGDNTTSYLPSGVGIGAGNFGLGSKPQQSLVDPLKSQANIMDFRQAEQEAAYQDLEVRRMTGTQTVQQPTGDSWMRRFITGLSESGFGQSVRENIARDFPEAVTAAQSRPGIEDISFKGEPGFVKPEGTTKTPADTINELRTLKIPDNPSMFEAVNWLTGAGLTGTALLSAGRQLRLDRPEYWDATGTREDIKEGVDRFLLAEFGLPNGDIDWEAAIKQDPYMVDTLEKLGYIDAPSGGGLGDYSGYGYGDYDYSFPTGSYGYGGVGVEPRSRSSQYPSNIGLVAWSI